MTERTACAACRFHHRRCPPDCIFRPYFPPEKPKDFINVQDLFRTNKIKQILQKAHEQGLQDGAAQAMKFESYVRKKFPVHGCNQVIWDLVNKIQQVNAELQGIRAETTQIKSAFAAASQFPTPPPPLNHNYFPRDFFSGGGDPESQLPPPMTESSNHNYGYATEFLAAEQALDSLSGETSTHAQQQLPDSDDLAPLTESPNRNYSYATEFLAAEQTLSLGVPYPPNNDGHIQSGDQSATKDFYSDGGRYGSFAYGEPTMNQPQQVLPDDDYDIFSFDFPIHTNDDEFIPTKETGDQIAKYMPKDDGNPFS